MTSCMAGELSKPVAWFLVAALAAVGIVICALNFGPMITKLYSLGLFLGTVYSVPPFRLKRFAIPAFLIIATVRGFLLNFGVYSATRAALGLDFQWSPAIMCAPRLSISQPLTLPLPSAWPSSSQLFYRKTCQDCWFSLNHKFAITSILFLSCFRSLEHAVAILTCTYVR